MDIIATASPKTMTSREIAGLTGKQHQHVKRDIEKMLVELGEDASRIGRIYKDGSNRDKTEYALDRELIETLLTGYSAPLRRAVIKRWKELEEGAPKAFDISNAAALRDALLAYSERVVALEDKVAIDAPKVAFAEIIRAVDGVCHIGNIGKMFGIGRTKFFKMLRDDEILMGNNLPYQKYIDREYFTVVEQDPYIDTKGVSHPTFTAMVTGAGQVFLAKRYKALK